MIEKLSGPRGGDRSVDLVSPTPWIEKPVIEFQVPSYTRGHFV